MAAEDTSDVEEVREEVTSHGEAQWEGISSIIHKLFSFQIIRRDIKYIRNVAFVGQKSNCENMIVEHMIFAGMMQFINIQYLLSVFILIRLFFNVQCSFNIIYT